MDVVIQAPSSPLEGTDAPLRLVVEPSLGSWAPAWDRLVTEALLPSPFLRSWWLTAASVGRPHYLLAVANDGRLAGGLALEEHGPRALPTLRMMGSGPLCPDHLDVIAEEGLRGDVLGLVRGWLERPGDRMLELDGVPAHSDLPRAIPDSRWVVEAVAPWMRVPTDAEAFLRGRSSNFRSNVRKVARRLDQKGVRHRVVPPTDVEGALRTLRGLHEGRWGHRSRFLQVFDRFADAARAGVALGEFSFHELVAGPTPIAAVACFEVAGRVSFYQSGRSTDPQWRGAGTLLLFEIMKDAMRKGLTEFDLLRGNEPYKASFATDSRTLVSIRGASGPGGWALLTGTNAVRAARAKAITAARRAMGRAVPHWSKEAKR